MSVSGSCSCGNIQFTWHISECTCVPRACLCDYCFEKGAAYVTEPGSTLAVTISDSQAHSVAQHGAKIARFHECSICSQVVFVTAEIESKNYGAVNASMLHSKAGLLPAEKLNFSNQSPQQKLERWRQNWCHPVLITYQVSKRASRRDTVADDSD